MKCASYVILIFQKKVPQVHVRIRDYSANVFFFIRVINIKFFCVKIHHA